MFILQNLLLYYILSADKTFLYCVEPGGPAAQYGLGQGGAGARHCGQRCCFYQKSGKDSYRGIQCSGSGSAIRFLFDLWIRDPGWVKNPDQG
jgi:hypothetical protein